MGQTNVISLAEATEERMQKAYQWAMAELEQFGITMIPVAIDFEDDSIDDGNGCSISLFRDDRSNTTLLRREWPGKRCLQYNLVTNFEEIQEKAPMSLDRMMKNAMRLCKDSRSSPASGRDK